MECENQMGRSKEEDGKGEIQGVKIKGHLGGSMKIEYSNSFIKYVHI